MIFELPKLNYEFDALEPFISADTVKTHYMKHHQGYVNKLNKSKYGVSDDKTSLEEIIINEDGDVYNNAAQVWNHNFYWKCMKPNGGGQPSSLFLPLIVDQFKSYQQFQTDIMDSALGEFGSGWVWLVLNESKKLEIMSSTDAVNPLESSKIPLLVIDVWEHAYYLDYKNERKKYVSSFLEHLINWEFVESCYLQTAENK